MCCVHSTFIPLIAAVWVLYASAIWVIIVFSSGLSPVRCLAITWTSDDLSSSGPKETTFGDIFIESLMFSLMKIHLKISSTKWRPWLSLNVLTHWGRVTHICVGKITIIVSDNGLSPGRHQAIIWTNVGTLLIRPLITNLSEILIGIQTFSFKKMYLKMSSAKWRPFCLGLNVLSHGSSFVVVCVSCTLYKACSTPVLPCPFLSCVFHVNQNRKWWSSNLANEYVHPQRL